MWKMTKTSYYERFIQKDLCFNNKEGDMTFEDPCDLLVC